MAKGGPITPREPLLPSPHIQVRVVTTSYNQELQVPGAARSWHWEGSRVEQHVCGGP